MTLSLENRGGTLQRLVGIWESDVIVTDDTIRYDTIRKMRVGGMNSDVSAYVPTASREGLMLHQWCTCILYYKLNRILSKQMEATYS
jgi:hypothetical protein